MADDLDDAEFWLPSEFLTDNIVMERENERGFRNEKIDVCFPHDFPYGFDSSESTLSDEEDRISGLGLHMSQSLVLGEEKLTSTAFWNENPKVWFWGFPFWVFFPEDSFLVDLVVSCDLFISFVMILGGFEDMVVSGIW